ncbi:MAG: malonyl-CoA decarboxylase [Lautropia sp.]|nr:malonyl-CoA decarboxylase [Lautropia sp.]
MQARQHERDRSELGLLLTDCRQLLTEQGESNSLAIAARALARYQSLSTASLQQFFEVLATEFDPDPGDILLLAEKYAVSRSPESLVRLSKAAEPPRQELLRRLNGAPGATGIIVKMRENLLLQLRTDRKLLAVDADLEHLLSSWFSPGFLTLVRVDWNSPAALLERLIKHEAVHAIDGWNDLRRRLEPDRRCFAFMHPVLQGEPLIFVEVALLKEVPASIAPLLYRGTPEVAAPLKFKVAAFYSISNCQPGLRGINLGNFLIKRVAEQLSTEFPSLKTFCTLSPVPGFSDWLAHTATIEPGKLSTDKHRRINETLAAIRKRHQQDLRSLAGAVAAGQTKPVDEEGLRSLCACYLLHASRHAGVHANDLSAGEGDPVARFHLNNGARLERINAQADLSRKGIRQSYGLMVNYLYDLDEIENNHQAFVNGSVSASRAVTSLI